MVYVGTLTPERSRDYAQAIRTVTRTTMFLFEAMIAQKAPTILEEPLRTLRRETVPVSPTNRPAPEDAEFDLGGASERASRARATERSPRKAFVLMSGDE